MTSQPRTAGPREDAAEPPATPLAAPERPDDLDAPPPRHRRWTAVRALVLVVTLLFFFVPLVAFLGGKRADNLDNRTLASRPSLADGWKFFPELTRWTADHFPLRGNAIRTDASVDERLFGQPPAFGTGAVPQVIVGRKGWLFFQVDLVGACRPSVSLATTIASATALHDAVVDAGKRFVLTVPPDKTAVERSFLPARFPNKACGLPAQDAFWSAMASSPPAGYVDVHGPVVALQQRTPAPVYRSKDSHWAPLAAVEYAHVLADALDPALWRSTQVVDRGAATAAGDLTRFTGVPAMNTYEDYAVVRPGVRLLPPEPGMLAGLGISRYRAVSAPGGAPLVQGRTLLLGDSFTGISIEQLRPLFADLTVININITYKSPVQVARAIAASRTVLVESVERAFGTGRMPLFTPKVIGKVQASLRQQ